MRPERSSTTIPQHSSLPLRRVLLLGATGTIGRATARALILQGHDVVCLLRRKGAEQGRHSAEASVDFLAGAELRFLDLDAQSISEEGFRGERFDAVVSCMASRTGAAADAWAVDFQSHMNVLDVARKSGVSQFVLLSAICVQKPLLEFQRAKLAFEKALRESGLVYSIVRPTAFFKSLSGQVERLKRGKPFLVFGNGQLTSCKPISDNDVANYLVECLTDERRWNQVMPIGGPGLAITPLQQGEFLFQLLGLKPRFTHVPVAMLDVVIAVLAALGRLVPRLSQKAELARIGRYYATESMLCWDAQSGRYQASLTPSTGSDTLFDFYTALVKGVVAADRGDHAVF